MYIFEPSLLTTLLSILSLLYERWWTYLVDSIRPVLCLQTEGAVFSVSRPTLPHERAIQEVGGIELDPWLAGGDLQDTPTVWMVRSEATEVGLSALQSRVCLLVVVGAVSGPTHLAASLIFQGSPGDNRQKLWSKPGLGTCCSRGPIRTGLQRSNGVPSTPLISPAGRLGDQLFSGRYCK